MANALKLRNSQNTKRQAYARGYILITLMLFVALLSIATLTVLPEIKFQIQRDREEEMIHRGVGYSRAIRKFYKKFNRYPTRVEELENTNNLRFLRKKYKDPITGKDFKILHLSDVHLNNGPVLGQGFVPAAGGGVKPGVVNPNQPQVTGLPGQNPATDSGDTSEQAGSGSSDSSDSSESNPDNQVFGGGPILGVASTSKDKTIREFNNKNHYNDWLFIYDPSSDRGGLLNTPTQPDLNRGLGGLGQPGVGQPVVGPAAVPNGGQQGGGAAPGPNPNPPSLPPDQ